MFFLSLSRSLVHRVAVHFDSGVSAKTFTIWFRWDNNQFVKAERIE